MDSICCFYIFSSCFNLRYQQALCVYTFVRFFPCSCLLSIVVSLFICHVLFMHLLFSIWNLMLFILVLSKYHSRYTLKHSLSASFFYTTSVQVFLRFSITDALYECIFRVDFCFVGERM